MALRLILVGAVAGLGLSLPPKVRVQAWLHSTQAWVNARLAEWDAQMPADESAFVVIADPIPPTGDAPEPAPTTAPVLTDTPAPPTTARADAADPAPAPGAATAATADPAELAAGLDVPTVPMALDDPDDEPAALAAVSPKSLDSAFDAAQAGVVASFAGDRPALAAAVAANPAPRFEPLAVGDDLYPGLAYALNRDAEGLHLPPAPARRSPRFEPLAVGDDLYPGLAYALNRDAEGLALPAKPAPRPASGRVFGGDTRLTQAVRLTREAVAAWANLLHGPAVVTIAH